MSKDLDCGESPDEARHECVLPYTSPYEDAASAFFSWIGKSAAAFSGLNIHIKSKTNNRMVANDLHSPWVDEARLVSAVEESIDQYGCNILTLTGDVADIYNLSRWAKERDITLKEELAGVRAMLEYLSASFKKVELLYGNHDGTSGISGGRPERFLQEHISREIRFMVKDLWVDILLPELDNVKLVGIRLPHGKDVRWLHTIGKDAVVAHWQLSSQMQGLNVERLFDWIKEWSTVISDLPRIPRLVLTGHTHRGTTHDGYDHKLIENGMFANWEAQEYMLSSHGNGPRKPGTYGWTLLVQNDDGVTDLKESRFIRCDR